MPDARYDLAIEAYHKTIAINPDYADAYFNLGVIYYGRGRFNESKKHLVAALKLFANQRNVAMAEQARRLLERMGALGND